MTYRFPNIGRQREAARIAAQIADLSGAEQNRQAELIVRCPRCTGGDRAVLCRVFRVPGGRLFVPKGDQRGTRLVGDRRAGTAKAVPVWRPAAPYWIDEGHDDEVRVRCRRCSDMAVFTTAVMLDHIRREVRTMLAR